MRQLLTWLECIVDQAGRSLRVEQAHCTNGDCNTLLFPDRETETAKFLVVGDCACAIPTFLINKRKLSIFFNEKIY